MTSDQQLELVLDLASSLLHNYGTSSDTVGGVQRSLHGLFVQSVSSAVLRRLMRELNELRTNTPDGIRVVVNEDNMLEVTGIVEGHGECL